MGTREHFGSAGQPTIEQVGVEPIGTAGTTDGVEPAGALGALRRQNELLRQTIVLCDRLTAMALRGDGIATITARFSRMLGHGVTVLDPMVAPLASAGWPDSAGSGDPLGLAMSRGRLREVLASSRGPLRLPAVPGSVADCGCVIAPITVGSRLLGYVAVASPEDPVSGDLDLFAVQHAATVYAQALLEEDRVGAFRLRFKREMFEALLRGHRQGASEAAESARLIGLDPDQPYQVVAIGVHDPDHGDSHRANASAGSAGRELDLETVVNALGRRWPDLLAVIQDEDVVVVAPPCFDPADALGGEEHLGACLVALLRSRFPATRFTFGGSRVATTLDQLGTARDQARATRKLAERLGRLDQVTTYEELGFYRLLLSVPAAELRGFADEVLGAVSDYDAAHGSDLLATLAVYLGNGGKPRLAAEKLFVHPNTVVYRIGKIQSLAGIDLSDPEDRLLCQAAVKAREALDFRDPENAPGTAGPSPGVARSRT